mgnify:CR=1 FL=1
MSKVDPIESVRAQMSVPLSFINAKLRGRRRRIYEGDRLESLKGCRNVKELWQQLYPRRRGTGRVALERLLRQDAIAELCSFTHLLPEDTETLYRTILRRFQVDNILVLLRLFAGSNQDIESTQYVPELPEDLAVPSGELLSCSNLEQFIDLLPPDLGDEARRSLELDKSQETTAFTEMAIERAWWLKVCAALEALSRRDRSNCGAPLLSELSSSRLMAVLRAGRAYDLGWEEVKPYLPPVGPERAEGIGEPLSDGAMEELFEDPTAENITRRVPWVDEKTAGSLVQMERQLWDRTFRLANRVYYGVMEGPSIVVCYFYVKRNELENLIETVEDIHYSSR